MTKEAYARSITASKFVLCPRGYGPNSVRMYETLALGRIPIIISDGFKLPLEQQIPYKKFCIAVDESKLDQIPSIVDNFLENHDWNDACQSARKVYNQYFQANSINKLVTESIRGF